MVRKLVPVLFCLMFFGKLFGQQDSSEDERLKQMITLSEVVVRNNLDVAQFLRRIKNDTTFYKAFRTLHVLGFTSLNDIRMLDKNRQVKASLQSKTIQHIDRGCRTMQTVGETTTGDIYDRHKNFNYYTAELYASLFLTKGTICGEDNIVKGIEHSTKSKSGIEKHKEQLKMLFFDPGRKIPGIPFIGNKINIFDPDVARNYDFSIDTAEYNRQDCYLFTIKAKQDLSGTERDNIVIDNITTWFNTKTMEIVGRNYDISYDAGVYDFDVHMEVQMTHFGNYLVPKTLHYNGTWDMVFKK
ncbi:MAG TPA: hypothetical protein VFP87_00205 [Chitinophagaceae bacterium]|nr:hypothetical protein [Chitinophagaceae bacterium]